MKLISAGLTRIHIFQQNESGGTFDESRRRIHEKYVDNLAIIIRDDSNSALSHEWRNKL